MGSCLSKKSVCSSSSPPPPALPDPPGKLKSETQPEKKKETAVKKELFIIKHRTSHELDRRRSEEEEEKVEIGENASSSGIQCGRLSRSSSTGKAVLSSGRRFSGSKKSYDFDSEKRRYDDDDGDDEATERENRRRTPSRERGGGSRRVSRSPGRRSESPISAVSNGSCRPGKMISVPATVSNAEAGVKRIQVIRNVGSPRAMSPARTRAANNSNHHPISLSRSNSRKAGVSPCRRNPLTHIHTNITTQKPNEADNATNNCSKQGHHRVRSNENLKTTRIRSSRQSRDLDVDPEAPSTPSTCSYTALLLQDIHNFHQKNTTPPPFSLPLCVTKARSILEAVADLNSTTDFPKYVTVRRGADDLESSGSNSFAGRSRSISRQNENGKKRDADTEQSGIRVLHRPPAFGMKMDAA